ncbi:MAG: sodium:solute symporter [Rhodothermaeota bacterium MED-G18]|nr:MAG: sodium:solute symporter [Rhodothermaeota bacterium MED-G18]
MSNLDFFVFTSILLSISFYGIYKNYQNKNLKSYILGDKSLSWSTIGLSVMATQASAITFISTPGQGYSEGMSFIQNYFGMPLALIIVSIFFIPRYYGSKVYTAYQYLEERFDLKVRTLTSFFFLLQRGFQSGITIYAPSIILTAILGWDMAPTVIFVGLLVVLYTVLGGSRAVSYTQKYQMYVILSGLIIAFYYINSYILDQVTFSKSIDIIKMFNKNNAISFSFDPGEKYTIWTGLLGGFFLSLSYFGTDQSQVSRYINAKDKKESRIGLMFNAILKIPFQFFILYIGILLFVFYSVYQPPVNFNNSLIDFQLKNNPELLESVQEESKIIYDDKKELIMNSEMDKSMIITKDKELVMSRKQLEDDALKSGFTYDRPETDFIFLHFILNYLPQGLIGLMIALILSAAMSSTSAEISALSAITTIDIYKRFINKSKNEKNDVEMSKLFTLLWGLISIIVALFFAQQENLIESINIIASLLYGNVLGIFLLAFFLKKIKSGNVFIGSIISQITVFAIYFILGKSIGYLWFNLIGTVLTCLFSIIFYNIQSKR